MTREETEKTLQALAEGVRTWRRAPILHCPHEEGLEYEDVFFPSEDGMPPEGWFIPRSGSDEMIIANHFEVNFVPDYKILHDAGYNVLAYDLRNFGHSSPANGGLFTAGRCESRDVIGPLDYVRSRSDTREMTIGLFSRCLGCNATMFAMTRRPGVFDGVRCMVSPQPLSSGVALGRALERFGVPASYMEDLNDRVRLQTSFTLDQFSPVPLGQEPHDPNVPLPGKRRPLYEAGRHPGHV